MRAGDILNLSHECHRAMKPAKAFAWHGAGAVVKQAEKRSGESGIFGLAARLGGDGKRGFAVAFKEVQDALEGALQRNFVGTCTVRTVGGNEFGFADAGDESVNSNRAIIALTSARNVFRRAGT